MIDWTQGYTATWRLYAVDRKTWSDGEAVEGFNSAKVTRSADGSLLESGSYTIDGELPGAGYYRLVMIAEQETGIERVEVATMLIESTAADYNRGIGVLKCDGRSVLYPAHVKCLTDGSYCPAGTDAAAYVAKMLSACLDAPVSCNASFALNEAVVFDFGSTVLEAAWQVLDAAGATLTIDGHGNVTVGFHGTTPAFALSTVDYSIMVPGVSRNYDLSDIPNRYVAVGEFETAEAINDDTTSVVSTVSRGYEHTCVDDSPKLTDGETLEHYAKRKLHAKSVVVDEFTYKREYVPGANPGSVVDATGVLPIGGHLRILSQSLDCSHGILVTEKAGREVNLWQS